MRRRAVLTLAAGGIVLALAPAAWAPTGAANIGVSADFDRGAIGRGQVAVAMIAVENRGPDVATGVVVQARVSGGRVLRATASPGRCSRPGDVLVRCTFRPLGFGSRPVAIVYVLADHDSQAVRVEAQLVRTNTPDLSSADNDAAASVRIGRRAPLPSLIETSFTFTGPADATVGRRFAAKLRLLNRGPWPIDAPSVRLDVSPQARLVISSLPRRLGVGEERIVRVLITPLIPGRLAIDVLVGQDGRARAIVRVAR